MGKKGWILLLVLMGAVGVAHAQQTIRGVVLGEQFKPVEGASVQLLGPKSETIAFAITSASGNFELKCASGKQPAAVYVSHLAYASKQTALDGTKKMITISLEPKTRVLKEVVVKAPKIAMRGDTLSYRLSAFASASDYTLNDALKKLPGIAVDDRGKIQYLGKDISNFYIEGLDLLGGRYNIATKNIPSTYVTSVEILNNHQSVKMDKKEFTDDVALNIKLAPKAKFKPVGSYELMAGWGREALYRLSGAGMFFNPRFQIIATAKLGNTEEFAMHEAADLLMPEKTKATAVHLLGDLTASTPPIKRNRFIRPMDMLLSFNTIYKLSEDETLKTNFGYKHAKTNYDYTYQMQFKHNAGPQLTIAQEVQPMALKDSPFLSVQYKNNAANKYLSNTFDFDADFLRSELPTLDLARGQMWQNERYRYFSLSDFFSWSWRKERMRWHISANNRYMVVPRGYISVRPEQGDEMTQMADSKGFVSKLTIAPTYEKRQTRIRMPLAVEYIHDHVFTNLLRDKHALPMRNDLYGNRFNVTLTPEYGYIHRFRKYALTAQLELMGSYMDYDNRGSNEVRQHKTFIAINPLLDFNYAFSANADINLRGSYRQRMGDVMDMLVAPIQRNQIAEQARLGVLGKSSAQPQCPLSL